MHILINNAAIIPPKRTVTEDGIETQFAVNHLAYFLLTNLLLDVIKASAPARIVNLASNYHRGSHVDFDDLQSQKSYAQFGWATYGCTKLYNILFTYELARRLQGTSVTVNAVHPGVIGTRLTRTLPGFAQKIYTAIMPSPENGAKPSLYLATSPALEGVTGKYFDEMHEGRSADVSYDEATAKRLWDISAEMTGLV